MSLLTTHQPMKPTLTLQDYQAAAQILRCETAMIQAFGNVEAPKGGFTPDDNLTFLFEPHIFWKRLKKAGLNPEALVKQRPEYCSFLYPIWDNTKYPKTLSLRIEQFKQASAIHPRIAGESASWGKFQIMGFNHQAAGFSTLDSMLISFNQSEGNQLTGFVNYIIHEGLDDELRAKAFKPLARAYNGEFYWKNQYDKKIEAEYNRLIKYNLA